jgi:hypothetical protein
MRLQILFTSFILLFVSAFCYGDLDVVAGDNDRIISFHLTDTDGTDLTGLTITSMNMKYYVYDESGATLTETDLGTMTDGTNLASLDTAEECVDVGAGYYAVYVDGAAFDQSPGDTVEFLCTYDTNKSVVVVAKISPPSNAVLVNSAAPTQVNATGGRVETNVVYWLNQAVAAVDSNGHPKVTIKDGTGQGELDTNAGSVATNLTQISDDANAAINMEKFFDGTGYYPANSVMDANMIYVSGDANAAVNIKNDYNGTGYNRTASTIGTVTDVTNTVNADIVSISGDTGAANNAEAVFDNTGYAMTNSTIDLVPQSISTDGKLPANAVFVRDMGNAAKWFAFWPLNDGSTNWARVVIGAPNYASATEDYACLGTILTGPVRDSEIYRVGDTDRGVAVSSAWSQSSANTATYYWTATQNNYMEFTVPSGHDRVEAVFYNVASSGGTASFSYDNGGYITTGLDVTTYDTGSNGTGVTTVVVDSGGYSDGYTFRVTQDTTTSLRLVYVRTWDTDSTGTPSTVHGTDGLFLGNDVRHTFTTGNEELPVSSESYTLHRYLSAEEFAIFWSEDGGTKDWTGASAHMVGSDHDYTYAGGEYTTGPDLFVDGTATDSLYHSNNPTGTVLTGGSILLRSKGSPGSGWSANPPTITWEYDVSRSGLIWNIAILFNSASDVSTFYNAMFSNANTYAVDKIRFTPEEAYVNWAVGLDYNGCQTYQVRFDDASCIVNVFTSGKNDNIWTYDGTTYIKVYPQLDTSQFEGGTDPTTDDVWSFTGGYSFYAPLYDREDATVLAVESAEVNVISFDSDTTSVTAIKSQYNGTGLSGDTYPATQAQASNIAVTGAAINTVAESYTLTEGEQTVGTYTATQSLDLTYHTHTDDAVNTGEMDLYYQFDVGGDGIPTSVTMTGYLQGTNDDLEIYAYDFGDTAWEQIGILNGKVSVANEVYPFTLLASHVGITGADLGKVRIRFFDGAYTLTSAVLGIDQIYVSYTSLGRSVGYIDGAVWVDTVNGVAGVESWINGTADNPCLTWSNAKTIATNMGLRTFQIAQGSTITLDSTTSDYTFKGLDWILDLSDEQVDDCVIVGAVTTGVCTGNGGSILFENCKLGAVTAPSDSAFIHCAIGVGVTFNEAGDYVFEDCFSAVAGTSTPYINFGTSLGDQNLSMRHYSGGIELRNMGETGTDNGSIEGFGQVVLASSCAASTLAIRGNFTVTDNASAAVTLSDDARIDVLQINEEADTALSDYDGPTDTEMDNSFAALNDFDPANDDVAVVTLVNSLAADSITNVVMATDVIDGNAFTVAALQDIEDAVWTRSTRTLSGASNITSTGSTIYIDANGYTQIEGTLNQLDDLNNFDAANDDVAVVTLLNGLATDVITSASLSSGAGDEIADQVWNEAVSEHTTSTTFGGKLQLPVLSADATADGVWDELQSGHTIAGSFGKYLDDEITDIAINADASAIADAVWDELITGHTIAGSYGLAVANTGDGSVTVDTTYGGGDYSYQTAGAIGIDNATVKAFLTSDYNNQNRGKSYVKGETTTDVNGNFASPLYLDAGSYTLHYFKQGLYGPDLDTVTVTE